MTTSTQAPSGITAILFDMDGTLADSCDIVWGATAHVLKAHGVHVPRDAYKRAVYHLDDVHALYPDSGSVSSYHDTFREYLETTSQQTTLYDGALPLLEQLKKRGYMLALVTAASRSVERAKKHGIAQYFDVIVGGEDCREHKPHPEPIFVATQRLGIRAEQAVMVGDTTADIQAGKAAGVACTIGLTHGMHDRALLEEAGADYIVSSLAELEKIIAIP